MEALDNTEIFDSSLVDKANALILGHQLLNDLHRTICRSIISDQELPVLIGLVLDTFDLLF